MRHHANIIGAGIAGLATAIALRQLGWTVAIYERADAPGSGGTALGMWPEAMVALDELGVGDRIRRSGSRIAGGTILNAHGAPIARIPSARSAHLVTRERLLLALLNAVPDESIHWSHGWETTDEVPPSDVVVGADGIHSAVRASTWGTSAVRPLNTIAFRGVVERHEDSVTETWGRGALFGITPTGDGRTNWFACLRHSRVDQAETNDAETLSRFFSGWHGAIGDVLGRVTNADIDRRKLCDVSLPHAYVRGHTALVGDAAHAMAPNLGRGACESLIDAVTLAKALDSGAIKDGLRRYDRARRGRTRRLVRLARAANGISTAERGMWLRDRLLRLAMGRWAAQA